jgi:hypothetical protein
VVFRRVPDPFQTLRFAPPPKKTPMPTAVAPASLPGRTTNDFVSEGSIFAEPGVHLATYDDTAQPGRCLCICCLPLPPTLPKR